jgi:hypothetical protein
MPAKAPGYSFEMRDGTVLPVGEVARGIYLIINDEPRHIFDKIWKFLEAEMPTDRRPQFEADFLEKMRLYSEAAALRVLITTKNNDERYDHSYGNLKNIYFQRDQQRKVKKNWTP